MQFYDNIREAGPVFLKLSKLEQVGQIWHSLSNHLVMKLKVDKRYVDYKGFVLKYTPVGKQLLEIPYGKHRYHSLIIKEELKNQSVSEKELTEQPCSGFISVKCSIKETNKYEF